jgi:hypothetical protein
LQTKYLRHVISSSKRGGFMSDNTNPRGEKRPRDGRGKGVGMKGGRRAGRNPNPCSPKRGYGEGKGQKRRK